MAVVEAATADLKLHPRNPRKITPARLEQLKRNLVADPEMLRARPLIALPDGTVIAGNQRLRAAQELGWTSIPVVYADLDDDRALLWALRDNRPFGEDDTDMVAEILMSLSTEGADLDLTGYTDSELDALLASVTQGQSDPDEVPPLPGGTPVSEPGAIYELGPHRLMCGDATDVEQVTALLAGVRVALVVTSPPYLDLREYGGNLDLEPAALAAFLPAWAPHADLHVVNIGLIVRRHEVVPHWQAYVDAAQAAGLKLLAWNVWNREDATSMAAQQMMFPLWHEWVFVFGEKPRPPHRTLPTKGARVKPIGQRGGNGKIKGGTARVHDRKPLGSVLTLASHKGPNEGDHPAVFPTALPDAYMRAVTDRGDNVADPFAGSGTTLIAAEQLRRVCYAMEIDPGYCDVIRERYARFTGRPELAP